MLGQIAGRSGSAPSVGRCFRYEVAGLRQSEATDKMDYSIRSSANVFITVPYSRMNEEMQRIARMGGKIVSIQSLTSEGESGNGSGENGSES
jgi:phycocyanin-associated, rod